MKYTHAQLAKEARRESEMRRRVYPSGYRGMDPVKARQLDMMDHIAVLLEDLEKQEQLKQDAQPDIFAGSNGD